MLPGVNVCVYGPEPVVTTEPNMCLNSRPAKSWYSSHPTSPPTVIGPPFHWSEPTTSDPAITPSDSSRSTS